MKSKFAVLCLALSFEAFAIDFSCEGVHDLDPIKVTYQDRELSFMTCELSKQVGLVSETENETSLRVYGYTKGIMFTGGGSQAVDVEVDLLERTASMTIRTHTFYRKSETTYALNCIVN